MLKKTISTLLLLGVCCAPVMAVAQQDEHHNDQDRQYVRHEEWKKGYHMRHEDWDRGQHVDDWRTHHLREPPHGYEWRQIDGNYVLANSNGVVTTVVRVH